MEEEYEEDIVSCDNCGDDMDLNDCSSGTYLCDNCYFGEFDLDEDE